MRTITINMPDSVEINNSEAAMVLSTKLYEDGKLSLGQAAEIVGLTKRTFIELLSNYNVTLFNFPVEHLSNDVANA